VALQSLGGFFEVPLLSTDPWCSEVEPCEPCVVVQTVVPCSKVQSGPLFTAVAEPGNAMNAATSAAKRSLRKLRMSISFLSHAPAD
jgi:hypothetical protein